MNSTPDAFADIAVALGPDYAVTTTARGWIEVRPTHPLRDKLDFIRVVGDDEAYFSVFHFAHNEVLRGEATLSNSMVGFLATLVRETAEVIW